MFLNYKEIVNMFADYTVLPYNREPFKEAPPLHPRKDMCAFLLLDSYVPEAQDMICAVRHERIYFNIPLENLAGKITQEQLIVLMRCGVSLSEDGELMMSVW